MNHYGTQTFDPAIVVMYIVTKSYTLGWYKQSVGGPGCFLLAEVRIPVNYGGCFSSCSAVVYTSINTNIVAHLARCRPKPTLCNIPRETC